MPARASVTLGVPGSRSFDPSEYSSQVVHSGIFDAVELPGFVAKSECVAGVQGQIALAVVQDGDNNCGGTAVIFFLHVDQSDLSPRIKVALTALHKSDFECHDHSNVL